MITLDHAERFHRLEEQHAERVVQASAHEEHRPEREADRLPGDAFAPLPFRVIARAAAAS